MDIVCVCVRGILMLYRTARAPPGAWAVQICVLNVYEYARPSSPSTRRRRAPRIIYVRDALASAVARRAPTTLELTRNSNSTGTELFSTKPEC